MLNTNLTRGVFAFIVVVTCSGTVGMVAQNTERLDESASTHQTMFKRQDGGNLEQFSYRFKDADQTEHAIQFAVSKQHLKQAQQSFVELDMQDFRASRKSYERAFFTQEIELLNNNRPVAKFTLKPDNGISYTVQIEGFHQQLKVLHQSLLKQGTADLQAQFVDLQIQLTSSGGFNVQGIRTTKEQKAVQAALDKTVSDIDTAYQAALKEVDQSISLEQQTNAKLVKQLLQHSQQKIDSFEIDYLKQRGYIFIDPTVNPRTIVPDYKRIAHESVLPLKPLANAIHTLAEDTNSPELRAKIRYLLAFFQTIPYDQLQDRRTSNGAGFAYPATLLANNRGDCDTKSVAFAAAFHALFPDIEVVLIALPGHALLGLGIPAQTKEKTLNQAGKKYVLVEPTGPGLLNIGEPGKATQQQMGNLDQVIRLF